MDKSPPTAASKKPAYAMAGVDIDSKMSGLMAIKEMVNATATKGVLGGIGSFGGLFASPGKEMMLVASTDGVGTKLKVAAMARRHSTVGQDLVAIAMRQATEQHGFHFSVRIQYRRVETPVAVTFRLRTEILQMLLQAGERLGWQTQTQRRTFLLGEGLGEILAARVVQAGLKAAGHPQAL